MDVFLVPLLVIALGSPSFAERENASRCLSELGPLAVPALQLAMKSSDAEVKDRSWKLLERWHNHVWMDWKNLPWITSLPLDFDDPRIVVSDRCELIRNYFDSVDVLSIEEPCTAPNFYQWRAATQLLLRDLLRSGFSLKETEDLLDRMREREKLWGKDGPRYEDEDK